MYAFPNYFHLKVAAYPFVPEYVNGRPVLQFVTKSAWQAGVQNNDILLAVNGRPLTGLAVFGEAIRTTKPGETLTVQVLRPGETDPRSASIQLEQATAPPNQFACRFSFGIEACRAHVLHPAWILGHGCASTGSFCVVPFPRHAVFLCVLQLGSRELGALRPRCRGSVSRRRWQRLAHFHAAFRRVFPRAFPREGSSLVDVVQAHRHHPLDCLVRNQCYRAARSI
jgi:PDZ domain